MRIDDSSDKFNKNLNEAKADLIYDIKKLEGKVRLMESQNQSVLTNFENISDTVVKLTMKEQDKLVKALS